MRQDIMEREIQTYFSIFEALYLNSMDCVGG